MKRKIIISKMFLEETKEENVRICSVIKSDKEDYVLWFEVEKRYEEYILLERADSFLVAILPYAIKHELDIYIENSISSKLYYQLTTYLVPLLCEKFKKRQIRIFYDSLDNKKYNTGKAVGTGISRGVDSLYTLAKYTNLETKEFNVTHLTLFNAGATGQYGGDRARELYNQKVQEGKKFAKENKFGFLYVDSNINEFLMMNHMATHTFRTLSCALLLQKIFSIYYYASAGFDFNYTKIDETDTAYYDSLILECLSTEDLTFYSSGIETNREGKIKEITKFKPSYNILNVCTKKEENCSICEKCKRTILGLYAIDKLELYKNVFDIDYFYKNKNKYVSYMLKKVRAKNHFYIDIYEEFKKNKKRIPLYVRFTSFVTDVGMVKRLIYKIIPKERIKKILKVKEAHDGWMD